MDGAGGSDYAGLLELARPAGRIVSYGFTTGAPESLDLFRLFWKQVRIIGSTLGTRAETVSYKHLTLPTNREV